MTTQSETQSLAQILRDKHLDAWTPVLERWLEQYRGLEQYIPCTSEHPRQLVMRALMELPDRVDDQTLAQRMARLDFLCWRARHADGERWQPLNESFQKFTERGQAYCWQWDTEQPEPHVTEAWLLAVLREGR